MKHKMDYIKAFVIHISQLCTVQYKWIYVGFRVETYNVLVTSLCTVGTVFFNQDVLQVVWNITNDHVVFSLFCNQKNLFNYVYNIYYICIVWYKKQLSLNLNVFVNIGKTFEDSLAIKRGSLGIFFLTGFTCLEKRK